MARLPGLDTIETTCCWPFTLAHLARAAAAIRARPAADILRRGPILPRVLFIPLSALIAVSRAFTCCAALSRSALNCAIMSMCSPRARIVADTANYAALCINVNALQSIVKFLAFLRSAAIDLPAIASYHSLTDGHAVTIRRSDHLALPYRRETGRRRDGRCL